MYLSGDISQDLAVNAKFPPLDELQEPNAISLGMLPAVAVLRLKGGMGPLVFYQSYNILPTRCTADAPLDNFVLRALKDVIQMVLASLRVGHSYTHTSGQSHGPILVVETVKIRKAWTQVPVEPWDWNVHMGRMMAQYPDRFQSGLCPMALWNLFWRY